MQVAAKVYDVGAIPIIWARETGDVEAQYQLSLSLGKVMAGFPVAGAMLAARTRHWWGRALIRRGEPERAAPLLTDARAAALQLGMVGVVSQIDALGKVSS